MGEGGVGGGDENISKDAKSKGVDTSEGRTQPRETSGFPSTRAKSHNSADAAKISAPLSYPPAEAIR